MKNIIIIHGIGGLHRETYFEHLKQFCEDIGLNVIMPSLGGYKDGITYKKWEQIFNDNYKHMFNKETIVLAQSVGTSFAVKYIAKNNLEIGCYISCAAPYNINKFRPEIKESAQRFVPAAKTFIPTKKEFELFKSLTLKKYSFYSNNDCFFEQSNLEKYSKAIGSIPTLLPNKNHFSVDGGATKIEEVEALIKSII